MKVLKSLGVAYCALLLVSAILTNCANGPEILQSPTAKVIGRIVTNAALNAAAAKLGADDPLVAQALNDIVVELNTLDFGSTELEDKPDLTAEADQLLADLATTVEAAETDTEKQAAVNAVLEGLRARANLSK